MLFFSFSKVLFFSIFYFFLFLPLFLFSCFSLFFHWISRFLPLALFPQKPDLKPLQAGFTRRERGERFL